MTVQEAPTTITIYLDGVIYNEGFNRETFLKTLETLNACVEKVHTVIPGSRHNTYSGGGVFNKAVAPSSSRSH